MSSDVIHIDLYSSSCIILFVDDKLKERLEGHNGKLKNKAKSFTNKNDGGWKLIYKEEFFSAHKA